MPAYLTANRPARDQWYARRLRPLTGCTVLHSTESVFDEVGEDLGAEGVARFIQGRSTPGSYHDLVDSDSEIHLVEYVHGAYHDGTGSNNWALSLAFACRTVDWARMNPAKRKAMLRNGARAFVRQQAYRRSIGAPLTEPRLITKAQSDAGMSGFTYHGYRDPGRRTDPGTTAAAPFPLEEFLAECRAALGGGLPDVPVPATLAPEEDLVLYKDNKGKHWLHSTYQVDYIGDPALLAHLEAGYGKAIPRNEADIGVLTRAADARRARFMADVARASVGGGGMRLIQAEGRGIAVIGPGFYDVLNAEELPVAIAAWGQPFVGNARQFDLLRAMALGGSVAATATQLTDAVAKLEDVDVDVDEDALAVKIAAELDGVNAEQVAQALRGVFADAADPGA